MKLRRQTMQRGRDVHLDAVVGHSAEAFLPWRLGRGLDHGQPAVAAAMRARPDVEAAAANAHELERVA